MIGKFLGKVAAAPFRVANIPAKVLDEIVTGDSKREKVAQKPLDLLAEAIEETGEEIDE